MGIYFVETKSVNPWWNLALEKMISERIKTGDVILYLWQNDRTVVIGRNQNALRECDSKKLEEQGGYLARRTTGGGAVYQDLGNLCFTFAASEEMYDLEKQMKVIQKACKRFGIDTMASGRNDILTKDGFKFSGNAFSNTATCKIQHGTLMISVDVSSLEQFLTPSRLKMKAKGISSVRSRVCNLDQLSETITVDGMKHALKEAFEELYGEVCVLDESCFCGEELEELYQKYASWEWRYGKTPKFEVVRETRFDWGEVELHISYKNMVISDCKVYTDALNPNLPHLIETSLLGKRYDVSDLLVEEITKDKQLEKQLEEIVDWLRQIY